MKTEHFAKAEASGPCSAGLTALSLPCGAWHNCAHRVWKEYGICRSTHVACKIVCGVRLSRTQ
jgi:hypothetical protein